ncbi:MAG: HAMP domain-containing protein [Gammaproteobacteria bacterium]|nr:HAMP domain-containing protein [Gammaproteobacteria bacterium]
MKLRFILFWKIFLWLWLTLILFIAVHFILTSYAQDQIHIEAVPDAALPAFKFIAKRLENPRFFGAHPDEHRPPSFDDEEFDPLFDFGPPNEEFPPLPPPEAFSRNKPVNESGFNPPFLPDFFFLDKQGKEIHGKSLDQALVLLHNQYLTDQRPHIAYKQENLFTGPFIINQDGETRYVYSQRRLSNLGEERLKIIWSQAPKQLLLSAVLITFPLCFALAWYLSSPIRRLQKATHEFSLIQKVPEQIKPLLKRGDEFGDLARDFKSMADQIQTVLEGQKRLLSDVSHELRSPLARLRIALGLVEQKTEDNPVFTYQREVDQMVRECERMDSLIEQLLNIARMDDISSNIETTEFDLCELLLEIKKDVLLEAEQKHVTFCAAMPDQQIINGVPILLRSAVENVLRNAVYYAPPNSKIKIQLSNNENFIALTITDQGPGVDEAHINKIFEPFYRPQYARERHSGGSGLGLAIAKRAIDYHNGRIWAENAQDSGSGLQVNIRLPELP